MKILVTGGAGYVGSFACKKLKEEGHEVVIFDNLENGNFEVPELLGVKLIEGDLRNKKDIAQALDSSFGAVMHFAAYTAVGPSMREPQKYFKNNVCGGLNLLSAMRAAGVDRLIFSSTSEVYGDAGNPPFTEDLPLQATNPYGESKVMFEKILSWFDKAYNFNYVALRYFNASGAALDGSMGEHHDPETHLIPAAMLSLLGRGSFKLTCATDLDTLDGTPIRDYTHVLDIADAHVCALDYLISGSESTAFNVGKGSGSTVLEIVEAIEEVTGKKLPREKGEKREGEPTAKWASTEKIERVLGWKPQYGTKEIVKSAWKWHKSNPKGYAT